MTAMLAESNARDFPDAPDWPSGLTDVFYVRPFERVGLVALSLLAPGADNPLGSWLQLEERALPGSDRRAQAAFMLGRLSWCLITMTAASVLDGLTPPDDPDEVAVVPEPYTWQFDARSGEAVRYRLDAGAARIAYRPVTAETVAAALTRLFTPVVEGLKVEVNLSRNALWRMIADSVAGGFLSAGRQMEHEDEAVAFGRAILADERFPFANGRSGYVRIGVDAEADPEKGPTRIFSVRGGCCRYYTVPEGSVCTSCVLRKPEERDGMLRAYYRRDILGLEPVDDDTDG